MNAIGNFFKTVYELFDDGDDDEDEEDNNEGESSGFWSRSGSGGGFWGMGGGGRGEERGRRDGPGGRRKEAGGVESRSRRRSGGGREPAEGRERRGDGDLRDNRGEIQTDSNGLTWRPLIRQAERGDGGVQGLSWYISSLHQDSDGDVANDFFVEVLPAQYRPSGNQAAEYAHIPAGAAHSRHGNRGLHDAAAASAAPIPADADSSATAASASCSGEADILLTTNGPHISPYKEKGEDVGGRPVGLAECLQADRCSSASEPGPISASGARLVLMRVPTTLLSPLKFPSTVFVNQGNVVIGNTS
ncbi:hypothetical protein CLOM_g3447 [Closterium sp. NIES-68]|nr:hypothetical protein CLOM_g18249 [Closterium sp. NIES-68]GJP44050.1 hypothetical protein CLOM_g3447 [Closterium sp. NIES-68]GJP63399.1 hypothetical protein CLOP_g20486 [Closterium sp. NIES-67]